MNRNKERRYSFEYDFQISDFDIIKSQSVIKTYDSFNHITLEKEASETILENKIKNSNKSIKRLNSFNLLADIKKSQIPDSCFCDKSTENDYLSIRKLSIIDDESFEINIIQKYNSNTIQYLSEYILNLKIYINNINDTQSIGPLMDIDYLIESVYLYNIHYKEEIILKKKMLKEIKYYRRVKGDGNCFYRTVIFQLFEIIIFNKKIEYLKGFIWDVNKCYENENNEKYLKINSTETIKYKLCIEILITIYYKLIEDNIEDAYKLFIFSMNSCKHFDLGLIWYYRYELFLYIKENENKLFSKNFDILIGNLLPNKFEKDGEFLFENFYEKYLLRLYTDAEKIIIYLTPYIFGINLNIYLFDGEKQFFTYVGNMEDTFEHEITMINKIGHYEILYKNDYYEKYNEFLKNYIYFEKYSSILVQMPFQTNFKLSKLDSSDEKKTVSKSEIIFNNFDIKKEKDKKIKCRNCEIFSEFLNDPLNKTQLCETCLKTFLINECISQYYMFINGLVNNDRYKLSQLKISIINQEFNFFELFELLQKYDKNLDKNQFKSKIMTMICINCKTIIQDKKIILPCDSAICNNCLNKILNNNKLIYVCPLCEYEYEKTMLKEIPLIDQE